MNEYDLSDLHSAVSAGEPLNREVIDILKNILILKFEMVMVKQKIRLLVGITKDMELKPGSMGKPTPGNRVEIINEEGKICAVGEVGDIAVHIDTPALFKDIIKTQKEQRMQFRGDYYVTGDKAKKDEEGYFWFEGRSDDIIISSGYTIGPFEVEDALVKHPYVKECAVVASPDEIRGNIVKAFVVLKDGITESEDDLVKIFKIM